MIDIFRELFIPESVKTMMINMIVTWLETNFPRTYFSPFLTFWVVSSLRVGKNSQKSQMQYEIFLTLFRNIQNDIILPRLAEGASFVLVGSYVLIRLPS